MALVSFYLDKTSIYAHIRYQKRGRKVNLKYFPGIVLGDSDKWFIKQRSSNPDINNRLAKIESAILELDNEFDLSQIDTVTFSALIEAKIDGVKAKATPFFNYVDTFLEQAKKDKGHEFSNSFGTVINKLREFDPDITFEKINKKFYRDFVNYLQSQNLAANSIGSIIRDLKRMLNKATDDDINKNKDFEDFKVISEDVYNIYLTEQEIENIYNIELTDEIVLQAQTWELKPGEKLFISKSNIQRQREALHRAKLLFVVGCWTGLRVENYLNIDPHIQVDIEHNLLHAIANKNGPKLKIPLHRIVRDIYSKYGMPETISQQKLNKQIKVLGRLAGITEKVIFTRTKGGKREEYVKKKYELITSHTARRSFASNLLVRGIPKQYIMAVTGHQKESSFNKYTKAVQGDMLTEKMQDYDVWK